LKVSIFSEDIGLRLFAASLLAILAVVLQSVLCSAQAPDAKQAGPKVVEETFPFPPPVQWKTGDNFFGEMEVSVAGVAWARLIRRR
jgi:hypothetical protein